jgi:Fe-S-cluster-containing dehydrogenase component
MGRKEMVIDLDRCTGCNLCIIACRDEHVGSIHMPWTKQQAETGHFWIDVKSMERGTIPKVEMTYLPMLCQHCENAPCMKSCPENAIERREDGLVWINQDKCTGCGLCVDGCPYGVIYFNQELKVAQKCTWCAHLIDRGEEPRCAEICPHDAIVFGESEDEGIKEIRQKSSVLHPEYGTRPLVYYRGLPRPFITGSVVDSWNDEVLSGVKVTVLDLFNDWEYSTSSDEFGDFWVRGLEKDHRYRVSFELNGYERLLRVVNADEDRNLGEIILCKSTR